MTGADDVFEGTQYLDQTVHTTTYDDDDNHYRYHIDATAGSLCKNRTRAIFKRAGPRKVELKGVSGRHNSLDPEINFCLSAMVRGMGEVRPEPFETCHLAGTADHRVEFLRRHRGHRFVAEFERVGQKLNRCVFFNIDLLVFQGVDKFGRNAWPLHSRSEEHTSELQ